MSEQPSFRISDERVREATGRSRDDWFALLDDAGAAGMAHADIARLLTGEHDVDDWWAQSVTVDYEKARGLRREHEKPDGYAISKSRTMAAPAAAVYEAWVDDDARLGWLDERLEVTAAQEERTVRGRWADGPSRVAVYLTETPAGKTQVSVQHERLADADAAEEAKKAWGDRLAELEAWLQARQPS